MLVGALLYFPGPGLAQDFRTGIEQLASQLSKSGLEGRQLRVAVADFPDLQGVTSDLGRFVASRLTTRLAQSPKFSVIERQRLGQVLAELRFGMSDLVDPTKAKQLGRMAGVEGIVVGTVSDLGNQVDLDARLIDIETNRMLLTATATISKDQVVMQMLERGRQDALRPGTQDPSPLIPATTIRKSVGTETEGFLFRPGVCRSTAGKLICSISFTNTGTERELVIYGQNYTPASRLIDNRGNQYRVTIRIGGTSGPYLRERFVTGVPVNVEFVAEDAQTDATALTVVVGVYGFKRSPVIRDIPISR
jgi:TolB-like protein